jgi:hypothetical protein
MQSLRKHVCLFTCCGLQVNFRLAAALWEAWLRRCIDSQQSCLLDRPSPPQPASTEPWRTGKGHPGPFNRTRSRMNSHKVSIRADLSFCVATAAQLSAAGSFSCSAIYYSISYACMYNVPWLRCNNVNDAEISTRMIAFWLIVSWCQMVRKWTWSNASKSQLRDVPSSIVQWKPDCGTPLLKGHLVWKLLSHCICCMHSRRVLFNPSWPPNSHNDVEKKKVCISSII